MSTIVGRGTVTNASHAPRPVFTVISAPQTIEGGSVSVTVTFCVQLAVFPARSVTIQVTTVLPGGNWFPAGIPIRVIVIPEQLS